MNFFSKLLGKKQSPKEPPKTYPLPAHECDHSEFLEEQSPFSVGVIYNNRFKKESKNEEK